MPLYRSLGTVKTTKLFLHSMKNYLIGGFDRSILAFIVDSKRFFKVGLLEIPIQKLKLWTLTSDELYRGRSLCSLSKVRGEIMTNMSVVGNEEYFRFSGVLRKLTKEQQQEKKNMKLIGYQPSTLMLPSWARCWLIYMYFLPDWGDFTGIEIVCRRPSLQASHSNNDNPNNSNSLVLPSFQIHLLCNSFLMDAYYVAPFSIEDFDIDLNTAEKFPKDRNIANTSTVIAMDSEDSGILNSSFDVEKANTLHHINGNFPLPAAAVLVLMLLLMYHLLIIIMVQGFRNHLPYQGMINVMMMMIHQGQHRHRVILQNGRPFGFPSSPSDCTTITIHSLITLQPL